MSTAFAISVQRKSKANPILTDAKQYVKKEVIVEVYKLYDKEIMLRLSSFHWSM